MMSFAVQRVIDEKSGILLKTDSRDIFQSER